MVLISACDIVAHYCIFMHIYIFQSIINTLFVMIFLLFFQSMPCNCGLIYIYIKTIFKGIWNGEFRLLVAHSMVSTYWDITFGIIKWSIDEH